MKILTDQDVYIKTIRFLRDAGFDVVTARELGLSTANDSDLLKKATDSGWIFLTRDRDFGSLVFVQGLGGGVIYLRLMPENRDAVHQELERVLKRYTEEELKKAFIVVEPGRHRFRNVPFPG